MTLCPATLANSCNYLSPEMKEENQKAKSLKVKGVFYLNTCPPPLSPQLPCCSEAVILSPASHFWKYLENLEKDEPGLPRSIKLGFLGAETRTCCFSKFHPSDSSVQIGLETLHSFSSVLLKVWSPDQLYHSHLENCEKCRFSRPTADLLNQKLLGWGSRIPVLTTPTDDADACSCLKTLV